MPIADQELIYCQDDYEHAQHEPPVQQQNQESSLKLVLLCVID